MNYCKPTSWGRMFLALALAGLLFVAGTVFLLAMFAEASAQTTVGGRQVVSHTRGLFGTLGIADDAQGSTVFLSAGEVRVTPAEVIVGGRRIPIPAACASIELAPTQDGVRVLFDGQPPAP